MPATTLSRKLDKISNFAAMDRKTILSGNPFGWAPARNGNSSQ